VNKILQRERQGWIAAVAVLSTSLVWLAALNLALLARSHADQWPALLAVLRAVFKAARMVAEQGLPLALLGGFVVVVTVLALIAPRPVADERGGR
jgi:hypothetical protein